MATSFTMVNCEWIWFFKSDQLETIEGKYTKEFEFGILNNGMLEVYSTSDRLQQDNLIAAIPKKNTNTKLLNEILHKTSSIAEKKSEIDSQKMEIRKTKELFSRKFYKELNSIMKMTGHNQSKFSFFQIYDEYVSFEVAATKTGVTFFYPFADISAIESVFQIFDTGDISG